MYKCVSCGVVKKSGKVYYEVKVYENGMIVYKPTCSIECAKETIEKIYSLIDNY